MLSKGAARSAFTGGESSSAPPVRRVPNVRLKIHGRTRTREKRWLEVTVSESQALRPEMTTSPATATTQTFTFRDDLCAQVGRSEQRGGEEVGDGSQVSSYSVLVQGKRTR